MSDDQITRADVCAAAIADAFAEDCEIFGSPMGMLPMLGVRLAKLTSNPDLVISDGESVFLAGVPPLFAKGDVVEGWIPFRRVFDVVAYGKRHVMMGATQVDRHGNQNISAIGDFAKPKRQLLGLRGFPGNSINHTNSFFVPNHGPRVFVDKEVDVVCSVGYRKERWPAGVKNDYMGIHHIVTDLCVMDFGGPDHAIRVISLHPGVSFEQVQAATGFPLLNSADLRETAHPTAEQLAIIRRLDPKDMRGKQIKDNPPGIRKPA